MGICRCVNKIPIRASERASERLLHVRISSWQVTVDEADDRPAWDEIESELRRRSQRKRKSRNGNGDSYKEEDEDEDEDEDEGEGEGEENDEGEEEDEGEEDDLQGEEWDEEEEWDENEDEDGERWPQSEWQAARDDAEEEEEQEQEEGEGEGEGAEGSGDDDASPQSQQRMPGGACFRRFVYAKRTKARRGTAAYAHLGEPWYSFVPIESLLNRAPLHMPFKGDGSFLLYNDDMA